MKDTYTYIKTYHKRLLRMCIVKFYRKNVHRRWDVN